MGLMVGSVKPKMMRGSDKVKAVYKGDTKLWSGDLEFWLGSGFKADEINPVTNISSAGVYGKLGIQYYDGRFFCLDADATSITIRTTDDGVTYNVSFTLTGISIQYLYASKHGLNMVNGVLYTTVFDSTAKQYHIISTKDGVTWSDVKISGVICPTYYGIGAVGVAFVGYIGGKYYIGLSSSDSMMSVYTSTDFISWGSVTQWGQSGLGLFSGCAFHNYNGTLYVIMYDGGAIKAYTVNTVNYVRTLIATKDSIGYSDGDGSTYGGPVSCTVFAHILTFSFTQRGNNSTFYLTTSFDFINKKFMYVANNGYNPYSYIGYDGEMYYINQKSYNTVSWYYSTDMITFTPFTQDGIMGNVPFAFGKNIL